MSKPDFRSKEDHIQHLVKMDAINLQGIWPNFPTIAATGRIKVAADLYRHLLAEELRKRKRAKRETPHERRMRIMEVVEKRLIQQDEDDLFIVLSV